jgi:hypothetical protein
MGFSTMLIAVDDRSSSPDTLRTASDTGIRNRTGSFRINPMEVSGRTDCELYPTTHMGSTSSFASKGPQGHRKVHEVCLTVDAVSG